MGDHKNHQLSGKGGKEEYFLTGLRLSSIVNTGRHHVTVSEIAAGMQIQLGDDRRATVLSVHTYLTEAERVRVRTDWGETSLCSEAYLACDHALCELYFGHPEVAFYVKFIAGHDAAFSRQPSTRLSECVALKLDTFGVLQIDGLNVYIPPGSSFGKHGLGERNYKSDFDNHSPLMSPQERLLLSPEETLVLGSMNCALADFVPPVCEKSYTTPNFCGGRK